MINQLIADYENILCTEEMNLVVGFYNTVGDFDAAMVLCEKLSAEGYGKSLNKANKAVRQQSVNIFQSTRLQILSEHL